uniref:Cleavage and polyadenylation specificity factor subunit 2 n=1 Tax=Panagrellus redivivus TaxID=6233 RepID=A0A7E4UVQ9_PANRE
MTSIIHVEPLSGVRGHGPPCYLLTVDDVRILLDCGWDEKFDMEYIDELKREIPRINAVLISYGDVAHCGALPYLVGKLELKCPIYSTVPVAKMGQLALYDWLQGHLLNEEFDLFKFTDIDAVFDRVEQLKYNQTVPLRGDNGLQITALPAGHSLGGAIWRITKGGDEEIVYAVDFNHKKERHLNGCTFENVGRPALMITDAYNALYNQPRRKNRDEQIVTQLLATLRDGGDCLVVIDTAGRVLEIAHLLDQMWANQEIGLSTYNLVMLSSVASSVIETAKSSIEWMADKIQKDFEKGRVNPFHLKNVKQCHSLGELNRVRSPKVVLASGIDMESGFSRELFLDWSADTRNMCILTDRSNDSFLGGKLVKMAELREAKKPSSNTLVLQVNQRVKLDGRELADYFEKKKAEHEKARKERQEQKRRKETAEIVDDYDSDDEDAAAAARAVAEVSALAAAEERERLEHESGHPANVASSMSLEQLQQSMYSGINGQQQTRKRKLHIHTSLKLALGDYLSYFHGPDRHSAAGPYTIYRGIKRRRIAFPAMVQKTKPWSEYGEIIDPEDYTVIEEVKTGTIKQSNADSDDSDAENDRPFALEDVPTKCIQKVVKVEVLCKVYFIDFEGRCDAESVKKLLDVRKPRKLVLVHGTKEATKHLAKFCIDNNVVQDQVFTPRLNESIDATVESRIIQVKLSENLMKFLKFNKIRDVDVCWINAKLVRRDPFSRNLTVTSSEVRQPIQPAVSAPVEPMEVDAKVVNGNEENEGEDDDRRVERNPEDERVLFLETQPPEQQQPHRSLYINDPKLTDVKALLNQKGFQAEFSSGYLFVENVAAIQRPTAGVFSIEGRNCMDYYRIRDIVKSQFAVI